MVDDEHAVRRVVAETLQRAGYEVVTATDGGEALLALASHPGLDLVITDLVMPGRDGVQVARDTAARLPGVPVLAISGNVHSDDAREAIHDRRFAFLAKPFRPSELLAVVSQLLAHRTENDPSSE